MRPERFARGAEQSRHARRRARQDSHKPGAAGTPDRSRPRQARRAFLLGPLFRSVAGAVSRGAGCMTMRIAYVCADPGVPVFGRKGCSVHVQEMLRALQGHGAGVDLFAARVDEAPPSGLESLPIHHLTPVGDGDPSSHAAAIAHGGQRSEEHTSELQSQSNLVCRLLLEKKTSFLLSVGSRALSTMTGVATRSA